MSAMVSNLNLNEAEKYWGRIAMRPNQKLLKLINKYYGKHLTVKITKWHNSCNTDPLALIFLQYMHCLMDKVC